MTFSPFWNRHVFVLVSSDAAYRGVQGQLLERLHKEEFTPVAARVVRVDPEMIDDLYADLIAGQWHTWRYRLVDSLLDLGPAIPLICRYDGTHPQPHVLLAQRKGNQHPAKAAIGTIRRDLGAVNSIVGLLHTSDGPAESEREAAVFGLSAADADPDPARAGEIDYLVALAGRAVPERRDFDATLASVRGRVVAAVYEGLPGPVRGQLRAVFGQPARLGTAGAGERLAGLLSGGLPPALLDVLRCDFTPQWQGRMRMRAAQDALRAAGVELDPWERLVLETSLHFPPLRGTPATPAAPAAAAAGARA